MTTYRRTDAAPPVDRARLQIAWAQLPILWWRDIPVTTREPVELNELDMFTIAAVERLGYLQAEVFEQVTGLPPLIFAGLARRLHSLSLLEWRDGVLQPLLGIPRPHDAPPPNRSMTTTLDILYLPSTDDLVVVGDGLGEWERAGPPVTGAAPLPARLHHVSLRTLLSERIAQRQVVNLPDDVVALADGADEPLAAMAGAAPEPAVPVCPVVTCAATVELDEPRPSVRIEVTPEPMRRRTGDTPVTVDLGAATGLVTHWSQLATTLATNPAETAAAMRAIGLTAPPWPALRPAQPGAWRLSITGDQARVLADHGSLAAPIGLQVRHTHARIITALRLVPTDPEAEAMLKRDTLLQQALQDPGTAMPPAVSAERGRVLTRAWQLRYFPLVHALREAEDFNYV